MTICKTKQPGETWPAFCARRRREAGPRATAFIDADDLLALAERARNRTWAATARRIRRRYRAGASLQIDVCIIEALARAAEGDLFTEPETSRRARRTALLQAIEGDAKCRPQT